MHLPQPTYLLERHPHGWLLKPAPGQDGVPLFALNEACGLFRKRDRAVIHPGIAQALDAIAALGREKEMDTWAGELDAAANAYEDRPYGWLHSTRMGTSSATLFIALANPYLREQCAGRFQRLLAHWTPSVPSDSADFGRCIGLLDWVPDWQARLPEVPAYWQATHPAVAKRWADLIQDWSLVANLQRAGHHKAVNDYLHNLNAK